jgi:hypothetical protein
MLHQELWGMLLTYNLIRITIIDTTKEDEELRPIQHSFSLCMRHIIAFLCSHQSTVRVNYLHIMKSYSTL